jgi:hypothetical protein
VKKTEEDKLAATVTKVIGCSASEYALGYSDAEHERLIRQAALIAPITERLFREAGIGSGQRVFELGSRDGGRCYARGPTPRYSIHCRIRSWLRGSVCTGTCYSRRDLLTRLFGGVLAGREFCDLGIYYS